MHTKTKNFRITISGACGAGKGSVGRGLSRILVVPFVSTGDIFRAEAEKRGLTLVELHEAAKQDRQIDISIDNDTREYGKNHDQFVLDARLGWFFIPDSFKIFLSCSDEERFRRIAIREGISFDQARDETIARESVMCDQYKRLYGIDNFMDPDPKSFDLIVDTTSVSVGAVVRRAFQVVNRYSIG